MTTRQAWVLQEIGKAWEREPEQRLGQLVVNAAGNENLSTRLFYVSDIELIELLRNAGE